MAVDERQRTGRGQSKVLQMTLRLRKYPLKTKVEEVNSYLTRRRDYNHTIYK